MPSARELRERLRHLEVGQVLTPLLQLFIRQQQRMDDRYAIRRLQQEFPVLHIHQSAVFDHAKRTRRLAVLVQSSPH